jgi:anti-sigma-K factor RskA
MNCDAIDELLAAYALEALSPIEAQAVRAHLASCRRHDEALAAHRSVAGRLALAVEEREPPPALRARLLDAFDDERARRTAGPARLVALRRRFAPLAAAAVLVLAVAGLLTWNLILQLDGDGDRAVTVEFEGGAGRLVYVPDAGVAVMELSLPEPPPARDYQAWGIIDGVPVSLGIVPHSGAVALEANLAGATAVAISEEPAGGSGEPTTEPFLVAPLP